MVMGGLLVFLGLGYIQQNLDWTACTDSVSKSRHDGNPRPKGARMGMEEQGVAQH